MNKRTNKIISAIILTLVPLIVSAANITHTFTIGPVIDGPAQFQSGTGGNVVQVSDTITNVLTIEDGYAWDSSNGSINLVNHIISSPSFIDIVGTLILEHDGIVTFASNPMLDQGVFSDPLQQTFDNINATFDKITWTYQLLTGTLLPDAILDVSASISLSGTVITEEGSTPEPATLALMGLGFAGMAYMRRRKTQA